MRCKECLHIEVCGRYSATGGHVRECRHFVTDTNVGGKRGHWVIHSSGRGSETTNWAECSECRVCGSPQWKVCPVCETKMEVEK